MESGPAGHVTVAINWPAITPAMGVFKFIHRIEFHKTFLLINDVFFWRVCADGPTETNAIQLVLSIVPTCSFKLNYETRKVS